MNEARQAEWLGRVGSVLGPALGRFNYLDDEQATQWTRRRDELFRRGQKAGLKTHDGNCVHLYTHDLSPGCKSCTDGTWSCLFINGRCNRRCFYCPQDLRGEQKKRPAMEGSFGQAFEDPGTYIGFLRYFGFRGMSVSGGEPFLSFEKTVEYVRRTREECGPEMHIWVYTNGSLYTRQRGEQLAAAGLDELRFDISANDYDLKWAAEAVGTIPVVSVEIPAIPEDKQRLLDLLPELEAAGVNFLNLHQMYATDANREALADRGYTLIRDTSTMPAVLESEICALEVMCEALERGIRLPINYCSSQYKLRYQGRARRQRMAHVVTSNGATPQVGTPTGAGAFRQFAIKGRPADNHRLKSELLRSGAPEGSVVIAHEDTVVYLHHDLLDHPAIDPRHVFVFYYRYEFEKGGCECTYEGKPIEEHRLSKLRRMGPLGQLELHNRVSRIGFRKLFLEGWSVERTTQYLTSPEMAGPMLRPQIEGFLNQIHEYGRDFEYLDPQFADYA